MLIIIDLFQLPVYLFDLTNYEGNDCATVCVTRSVK